VTRAIILCLLLSGCVSGARTAIACRDQAGPEPYISTNAFGLFGAAWAAQQPDHKAWQERYHQCVVARTAAP